VARKPNFVFEGRGSELLGQQERLTPVELYLPPAHPKQAELINCFDARIDPKMRLGADGKPFPIYDSRYPNFYELPKAYPDLKFVAGACGTKFGKTYGCSIRIVKEAWDNPDSLNWWVAPTYKQAEIAYRLVRRLLPSGSYIPYKADLRIEIIEPDGKLHSTIEFKSAENDDNLRGFGVHFFVLDEAARISRAAYDSVMTTTTQTEGRGIIISTPKGRGWFYEEYQRGVKDGFMPGEVDNNPEWLSIRMPTWTNPTVNPKRILMMRKNMPSDVFEQEVAARFNLEGAGVFRGIQACIKQALLDQYGRPIQEQPIAGHRYVIGVDLARKRDYTVITVVDVKRRHVVYFDRFTDMSWSTQKQRIIQASKMFNRALVIMDGTGLGDPIVEDVRNSGTPVECFIISNRSKQDMIEKLRASVEFQRITFPYLAPLVKELKAFEYDITASGNIRYSAPSGQHDDCVISLGLANIGLEKTPFVYQARQVRGL
jgi:hypothetical protein